MMGLQLIFVVETNKKCKSDWIYIKDTIERFYNYDQAHVKFTPIYMDGRGKYQNKEQEILKNISQYASTAEGNRTRVIYCFDCDDYDIKPEDAEFLRSAQQYCSTKGYDFVWFCKDVERVYIGKKVDDGEKKRESATFKAKKLIVNVEMRKLCETNYKTNTSNIMKILDKYLERK